eukprot:1360186-Amphidinium_carterae.1
MEARQRLQDAYDRQKRRDEGIQGSFRGTKKELEEMRNSLLFITVAGRRQRLQERERTKPKPKAPPQGVRLPMKETNKMTMQELREAIQEVEEKQRPGYYVDYDGPRPPPPPSFQKWKDRLEILENQRQEEEDRLEHHRQ